MLPLRLVIDTNVVVSGALKPSGLERSALNFALTRPALFCVSPEILAEYKEVLGRPELRIPVLEQQALSDLFASRTRLIHPTIALSECRDPDDNMFLECADAARADYLLTGNPRHFPAFWKSTKIINCREFMTIIAPHVSLP